MKFIKLNQALIDGHSTVLYINQDRILSFGNNFVCIRGCDASQDGWSSCNTTVRVIESAEEIYEAICKIM